MPKSSLHYVVTFCFVSIWTLLPRFVSAGDPHTNSQKDSQVKVGLPNVVLLVVDTLRADHLPFYGYSENTAPFLSSLAKEAVLFDKAIATSSWTAPATASIVTSLHPIQHGVHLGLQATKKLRLENGTAQLNRIPEKANTLAEHLKKLGYITFLASDNANISKRQGFTQGIDYHKTFRYAGAQKINTQLKQWKTITESKKPYFMHLQYMDPHDPYHKRDDCYKKFTKVKSKRLRSYDSEICYVDAFIEEMYKFFSWDKNTIIVFTSDHGEEFLEHEKYGHGKSLYQEVLHVPLFFYYPEAGFKISRINDLVSPLDILPTILKILDIKTKDKLDGISLFDSLTNGSPPKGGRTFFAQVRKLKANGEEQNILSAIHGNWKLISSFERKAKILKKTTSTTAPVKTNFLFDLASDPGEFINKLDKASEIADELMASLEKYDHQPIRFTPEWSELTLRLEKKNEKKNNDSN